MHPFFWGSFFLILSQALAFSIATQVKSYLEQMQIVPPEVGVGFPVIYFFVSVAVIGVVLFFVPPSKLRIVLKVLFVVLYTWGIYVALSFVLPFIVTIIISISIVVLWLVFPRVWLHNALLTIALASIAAVFGFFLSPVAALVFMLVVSIYDYLAVRFGYMVWMAKKLFQAETLPAFFIPKDISGWNVNVKEAVVLEDSQSEKEFSVLGGGDIGFPLLLIITVFVAYGMASSVIMAAFSLLGLAAAFGIQRLFLKGKPMPALPPISAACLLGFLIVYFI